MRRISISVTPSFIRFNKNSSKISSFGASATALGRFCVFAAVATVATVAPRATATFFLAAGSATATAAARLERPPRSRDNVNQTSDDNRSDNRVFRHFSLFPSFNRRAFNDSRRCAARFPHHRRKTLRFACRKRGSSLFSPFYAKIPTFPCATLPILIILPIKRPLNSLAPQMKRSKSVVFRRRALYTIDVFGRRRFRR